jgi:MFS family permease
VLPRQSCARSNSPTAVQGLGAGAITSSVQIMLSDLVTLRERGTFSGLMALCVFLSLEAENLLMLCSSWAIGGGVGPVIGGSLAQSGYWYALCW